MGYRHTRKELIDMMQLLNDKCCKSFFELSHEEKADPIVFESFCKRRGGVWALILSDDVICDNKELVLIASKYGFWGHFEILSNRLLDDPDIAIAAADCNRYEYTKISKRLRDDPKLMLEALRINHSIFCSLPVKVKIDRDILLEIAKNDPTEFIHIRDIRKSYRDAIFSDKELALLVAENGPYALEYFNEDVLGDKDVLRSAFCLDSPQKMKERLLEYTWGFKYLNQEYWLNDKALVKKALKIDGSIYEHFPEKFKNTREYALIAVKSFPEAIAFCPEEFRDDDEIVKLSFQEDTCYILEYASERIRDDYDMVYKAVKADPLNLQYASERLKDDKNIVLIAIKGYGGVLEDASERLQNDKELISIAEKNL